MISFWHRVFLDKTTTLCFVVYIALLLHYVTLQLLLPLVAEEDLSWCILGNIYFCNAVSDVGKSKIILDCSFVYYAVERKTKKEKDYEKLGRRRFKAKRNDIKERRLREGAGKPEEGGEVLKRGGGKGGKREGEGGEGGEGGERGGGEGGERE